MHHYLRKTHFVGFLFVRQSINQKPLTLYLVLARPESNRNRQNGYSELVISFSDKYAFLFI